MSEKSCFERRLSTALPNVSTIPNRESSSQYDSLAQASPPMPNPNFIFINTVSIEVERGMSVHQWRMKDFAEQRVEEPESRALCLDRYRR